VLRGGARARVDVDRKVDVSGSLRGSSETGLFESLGPALFLVDGGNLLWRAAHGHPAPFTASDGRDVTPLFRFFTMLRRALGTYGLFAECVVCFDGPQGWSARLAIDDTYKANRRYDDVDLSFMGWLPEIQATLGSAGMACIEMADEEADDVIASLAWRVAGRPVRILSTDRDYFQLLSPGVTIVNPRCSPSLVDGASLLRRYGVSAAQWCDFRAIAGDQSDGIPGVHGVGPKRAAELLAGGAMLDELWESGRLDPQIARRWADVLRWRQLIRLRTDVALAIEPTGEPSPVLPGPVAVCRELGLI
jgi:DNA polymerase-1